MMVRHFAEVAALHLEPETFERLQTLAIDQPGRPGCVRYDFEDPWHALVVEPHRYGCWVATCLDDIHAAALPVSLTTILAQAREADASWVLFDSDLLPFLDQPVFAHP